ncbi:chromate resistance protein ChrB domain-containing protein [Pandoraea sp.]|uniref:chromate resistance protein ChrB domain-containing protein n=1 Tax=Pandoraea sp. TaxID=1883445 RepID=UPI0012153D5C|nr:chromate resistance protein ChrB domain-containing protein [Pandoraea sp.]MBU6492076.1 chromate resistance protein [Burkholderiales bacterium]MDE2287941.1 chromate resistance protein [Burkholderiales bacterium]TAL55475.1 MAG: hypothetical protein EPN80_07080 [Pandoraea sp.]TAM17825.1 MAG: hypothetical protein EPN65_09505 [Pandoraea sp.]
MNAFTDWLVFVLTLPTDNATARMRYWRALKARGCAVLRDGVYLLPGGGTRDSELAELGKGVIAAGGIAHLMHAPSRDADQEGEFRALFDRAGDYADFVRALAEARKTVAGLSAAETTRLLRRLGKEYEAIRATDYFPSDAAIDAEAAWQDFTALIDTITSPGEPHCVDGSIARLQLDDYRNRHWATRRRLWVDRVASAWLIRRFIDPQARFSWLASPDDCPPDALGFDFDGAAFTHVGALVTFQVLAASFGLDHDAGLRQLGEMVRALDVGGAPVPQASGFEAVLAGARQRACDDNELLDAICPVLDSLHAYFSSQTNTDTRSRP